MQRYYATLDTSFMRHIRYNYVFLQGCSMLKCSYIGLLVMLAASFNLHAMDDKSQVNNKPLVSGIFAYLFGAKPQAAPVTVQCTTPGKASMPYMSPAQEVAKAEYEKKQAIESAAPEPKKMKDLYYEYPGGPIVDLDEPACYDRKSLTLSCGTKGGCCP